MAVLFDTLKLAERLEAAGMGQAQARGVAAAIAEAASGDVATKADIEMMRGEIRESELRLRTEIEKVRTESRESEVRLLRAMATQSWTIIGAVAGIVGLAAALTHLFH
jgi:hypothetical protein